MKQGARPALPEPEHDRYARAVDARAGHRGCRDRRPRARRERYKKHKERQDVPAAEQEATGAFWAGALGSAAHPDDDGTYLHLEDLAHPIVFVQALGEGEARVHLDIETDDVAAEVSRLTGLGAVVEVDHGGHQTLRAPGGHLFCVVPIQSKVFDATARTWP